MDEVLTTALFVRRLSSRYNELMENMEFEDRQSYSLNQGIPQSQKGAIGWLIQKGIAKDTSKANNILLVATVLFIILTIAVYVVFIKSPSVPSNLDSYDPFDPALELPI
ncbi:MAG: uncharacterized membrane protein YbaN (DUF454 family) [Candidatus Paceibacteria bacterium]|jgi:uncharacterized membrane protein YbaN (DUF454 family)